MLLPLLLHETSQGLMAAIIDATRRIVSTMVGSTVEGVVASPDVVFGVTLTVCSLRTTADLCGDATVLLKALFENQAADVVDELFVYAACGVIFRGGSLQHLEAGMLQVFAGRSESPLGAEPKLRGALLSGFGCVLGAVRDGNANEATFGRETLIPAALSSIDLNRLEAHPQPLLSLEMAASLLEIVLSTQSKNAFDNAMTENILAAAVECVQNARAWLPRFSNAQYFADAHSQAGAPSTTLDVAAIVKLISRRILVPLLSQTLIGDAVIPDTSRNMAEGLVEQLATSGQMTEVIIVAASLFDLLFINRARSGFPANPELFKRSDFRFNAILWEVVLGTLRDAMVSEDLSSVQRATLELQVAYLLKRIVSVCEDESGVEHADKRGDPTVATQQSVIPAKKQKAPKKGKYADPTAFVGEAATSATPMGVLTEVQQFSPTFVWCPNSSSSTWNSFFLVLETLNEFGVHIVTPALEKVHTELVPAVKQGLLHPIWVELLFIKGLRHGNTGVRKAALGALWATDMAVLMSFSPEMLCQGALETAVDGRITSEIDRIVTPSNFLEVVARDYEDIPTSAVAPIVNSIVAFYTAYISAVASGATTLAVGEGGELPTPEELVTLMILTVSESSPRFSIATTLRVVMEVTRAVSSITVNGNVMYALHKVYKESIVDKHPQWMQARLVALCVDTALAAAVHTKSIHSAEYMSAFEDFIGLCAKGGDEGRQDLQLDAPGISQGSVLGVRPVVERLVEMSTSPEGAASCVLQRYLSTVEEELHAMLSTKEPIPHPVVKSFATKAACLIAHQMRADVVLEGERSVWLILGSVTGAAASVVDRVYCDLAPQINAMRLFSEVVVSVGVVGCAPLLSPDVVKTIVQGANALLGGWVSPLFSGMPPAVNGEQFDSVCDVVTLGITLLAAMGADIASVYEGYLNEWVSVLNRVGSTFAGVIARHVARVIHALCVPYAALRALDGVDAETIGGALAISLDAAVPLLLGNPVPPAGSPEDAIQAGFPNTGSLQSMTARYSLNVLYCFAVAATTNLRSLTEGSRFLISHVLGDWASDAADVSASNNLPQLFSLVAATSQLAIHLQCVPATVSQSFELVWGRQKVSDRRAAIRCGAIAFEMLSVLSHVDSDRALAHVRQVILNDSETDRTAFLATLVSCSSALMQSAAEGCATVDPLLLELLIHQSCITNRGFVGENEMENCVAVVETPFLSWPEPTRRAFPASPAVVAVARALSISVVLHVCKQSEEVSARTFIQIIELLKTHPDVVREPCMPNSKAHRCRIRILQLLGLLLPLIPADSAAFSTLASFLFDIALLQNNMGSVRRHYELLAIKVIATSPQLIAPHLTRHLADFELKAQAAASIAKVAINIMLLLQRREQSPGHIPSATVAVTSADLFAYLRRLGNSYQHLLRIVAHIGAHAYLSRKAAHREGSLDQEESRLFHYLNSAGEVLKFRDKHYDVVVFDWERDMTPASLMCVQRMEGLYWLQDSIGWDTFWRCGGLESELTCLLRMSYPLEGLAARSMVRGLFGGVEVSGILRPLLHSNLIPAPPGVGTSSSGSSVNFDDALRQLALAHDRLSGKQGGANHARKEQDVDGGLGEEEEAIGGATNMQRKVQSWWASEIYNELHPRSLGRAQRQPLVIVGSLLENPVNIAGLCRCADIFAVEGVVVPNRRVFEHPHFIAAARSAEKWVHWEEVPESGLAAYLRGMRLKGYTTVGVEQTADSQSMATYRFPERAVVVLGSEGKGIPPGILPFLDVCVEIPQFGLIRSLNVHVTGALAMYEYTKQHLMDGNTTITAASQLAA